MAAVASCSHGMTFVMQQYEGPPRPKDSVAFIRVNGGTRPEVVAVDGEPLRMGSALEPGNRLHVEILPGVHEVDVESTDPTGLSREIPVRFVAESGHVYRVDLVAIAADPSAHEESTWTARVYEVSTDTDAKVGIARAAPPAAVPARPEARAVAIIAVRDAGVARTDGDTDPAGDAANSDAASDGLFTPGSYPGRP